tara:strand:- start:15 stop:1022 length:1008 start_codon:yes stop_codon:yes gene_type:complete
MTTEFATNQNKAFLWDFLYKNGMFKNLSSAHEQQVKLLFEKEIHATTNSAENLNTTELNKRFISKIVQSIEVLKESALVQQITPPLNKTPELKTAMKYTHQEAAAERQKLFQNNLQETQNNFRQHMNVEKPKPIDFSDKDTQDTADPNLDSKLAEIVERRKRDMNMVLSTYDTTPAQRTSDNISIGKETKLDSDNIVEVEPKKMKKNVSFDENNIATALGKNINELFNAKEAMNKQNDNDIYIPDTDTPATDSSVTNTHTPGSLETKDNIEYTKLIEEKNTVESFLSRLKTKNIKDDVEKSEASLNKETVTLQTVLREISELRNKLDHILDIIKK